MPNEIESLHTAIRRYCFDRYSYWSTRYGELISRGADRIGSKYTEEALDTFPRYNVIDAILVEVERCRPQDLSSLDEAKTIFRAVCASAQSIFTQPPNGQLEQTAMNEERLALDNFIANLTLTDLSKVEPLFYRRVLTSEESAIWAKLQRAWDIAGGYWYPLANLQRTDVEAFQDSYLDKEVGAEKLRTILRNHGVQTLFEMREDGINYELELSIFEPNYSRYEGYWCDVTFEWIIYASHESSITIGGWLLREVKSVWANWQERVWTTPFFS
jgi:hypothetical protein